MVRLPLLSRKVIQKLLKATNYASLVKNIAIILRCHCSLKKSK